MQRTPASCAHRSGRRRREAARRQGGGLRLDLHAARRRHADRHLRQARPRDQIVRVQRRCQDAAGADLQLNRHRHRFRARLAFMVKGVPAKAVGAMAGVPRNMAVMVGYNSPVKTVDDLKGRKLGVTTVGSLTDWIGKRINGLKGWGRPHHHGPDRRHAAGARRHQDRRDRRLYRRAGDRLFARRSQGVARHHVGDSLRRAFHHARVLRARGRDREASAGGEGLPAGLAGHHRVHETEQGQGEWRSRPRSSTSVRRSARARSTSRSASSART